MQKYLLKKADGTERFIFDGDEEPSVPEKPKVKIRRNPRDWEAAVHLSNPSKLTNRQKDERRELLRICKFHGQDSSWSYEQLSLHELREWKADRIKQQIKNLTV